MYITRGTTPDIIIDTDISLVGVDVLYVTFKQGIKKPDEFKVIEFTKDDMDKIEEEGLYFRMSQEQTLAFKENLKTMAQIRARYPDGTAVACDIEGIGVKPILKEGVI